MIFTGYQFIEKFIKQKTNRDYHRCHWVLYRIPLIIIIFLKLNDSFPICIFRKLEKFSLFIKFRSLKMISFRPFLILIFVFRKNQQQIPFSKRKVFLPKMEIISGQPNQIKKSFFINCNQKVCTTFCVILIIQ